MVSVAVAGALLGGASVAYALPTGGQVSSGLGRLAQDGGSLTVSQSSQKLAVNWQNFSIAGNETVNFVQPNASAIVLNRVLGNDASAIYGKLNANGQVFLINSNGILVGRSAEVNVGGLVASTLNLSDADFLKGKRTFSANGGDNSGAIVNLGNIKAEGGYIAFLGAHVSNQGTLQAKLGSVALAAGQQATLDFNGDNLINVQVEQGALNALAENRQLILADGGKVILTAQAADHLVSAVVNNSGVIRAQTLQNHAGTISLLGDMQSGLVNVGGTLDASAPGGGNGGLIETSAAHVKVTDDAKVVTTAVSGRTGTWLIDPQDYTVAASGGDISGTTLSNNLGSTNVTLQSSSGSSAGVGDVNVNDAVTWNANTTLTLTASNNVNVNAPITATGSSAGLAINPNSANGREAASGTGSFNLNNGATITLPNVLPTSTTALVIGGTSYTVINGLGVAGSTTATDLQGINGNLAGHYALGSDIDATVTANWNRNNNNGFMPIGNGTTPFTGMFDGLGHTISGLTINTPSSSYVGMFGQTGVGSSVQNVGLLGGSFGGTAYVGALVGWNYGAISKAYATGNVSGASGSYEVGGLVGENDGTISSAYATGTISGSSLVGGLAGFNAGTITNAYAIGSVSGTSLVGGLVGWNISSVSKAYAAGGVIGSSSVGGFVGKNSGAVSSGYWNKDIKATGVGAGNASGALGLTTAQMRTASSFSGFTFTATPGAAGWVIVDGDGTLNNAAGASGATTPMLASEYATTVNNAHQLQLMVMAPSASYAVGGNIDASATANSKDVWGTKGFAPVGNFNTPFNGGFDGRNQTISGLTINMPSSNWIGLFGVVGTNGVVQRVGLAGGSVIGTQYVGGMAGRNDGTISNVYATGSVSGTNDVGGLVGHNTATISNAYATGSVSGASLVGGLVGNNDGAISDSYAAGSVSGTGVVGGLVGNTNLGTVTNSFWNTSTSGQASSDGGIGLTNAQVQTQANFTTATSANGNVSPAWDFNATWVMYDGHTAPLLRSFMTPLTVTANNVAKTYDGLAYSAYGVTYSTAPNSNLLGAVIYGGTAPGASTVGTYAITPEGLYSNQQGYVIGYSSGTLTVNPASLTVIGSVASNKVYDGSTAATVSGGALSGVVPGDAVTLTQAGVFASRNVGNAIAVAATDSLSGTAAANYMLIQPTGLAANITPKPLTVLGTVVANKIYDGSKAASVSGGALSGIIAGDVVTLVQSGLFSSKNAGNGIAVTASDNLGGAAAGNYSLIQPSGLAANITPKQLTVGGTTVAANKVYDATTSAAVSGGSIAASDIVAGDTVSFSQAGSFSNKNVGTAKAVSYSNSLSGTDAGNYGLSSAGGTVNADITARTLSVINTAAVNKMYDGTTAATMYGAASVTGVIEGDALRLIQTGSFADKNVATYKTVTYSNTLTGADAGNYTLASNGGLVYANIFAKALTVTGTTVASKVYDGTTKATLGGGRLLGVIAGDKLTLAESGVFATKNAGVGVSVIATDSLGGTSAGNYTLIQPLGLTASIMPKTASVSGTKAVNKVYDGTTVATFSGSKVKGLVAGDIVVLAQSGNFADKNVGKNKTVFFSNGLKGSDSGNYILTTLNGTAKAKITPLQLAVDDSWVEAQSKVYDGTTAVTIDGATVDPTSVIAGDKVGFIQSGHFLSKTIGTDKPVTYKFGLSGADAGNYSLDIIGGQTIADIIAP